MKKYQEDHNTRHGIVRRANWSETLTILYKGVYNYSSHRCRNKIQQKVKRFIKKKKPYAFILSNVREITCMYKTFTGSLG